MMMRINLSAYINDLLCNIDVDRPIPIWRNGMRVAQNACAISPMAHDVRLQRRDHWYINNQRNNDCARHDGNRVLCTQCDNLANNVYDAATTTLVTINMITIGFRVTWRMSVVVTYLFACAW